MKLLTLFNAHQNVQAYIECYARAPFSCKYFFYISYNISMQDICTKYSRLAMSKIPGLCEEGQRSNIVD